MTTTTLALSLIPGEDAAAERDALAAKVERVRAQPSLFPLEATEEPS